MLIRKCAQGHQVYIFRPRTGQNITYRFSDSESISFDAQNKKYIITNDGSVVLRTDSWEAAENEYLAQCETHHADTNGRLILGESTLENGVFRAL